MRRYVLTRDRSRLKLLTAIAETPKSEKEQHQLPPLAHVPEDHRAAQTRLSAYLGLSSVHIHQFLVLYVFHIVEVAAKQQLNVHSWSYMWIISLGWR